MAKHLHDGKILNDAEMADVRGQQFSGGAAIICGVVAFLATLLVCFGSDKELGTPLEKIAIIAVPITALILGYRFASYVYILVGIAIGGTALFYLLSWVFA